MKRIAFALAMLAAPAAHAQVVEQSALQFAVAQGAHVDTARPVHRARVSRRSMRHVARYESRGPRAIRTAPQIVADAVSLVGARNPFRFRGPGCKVGINRILARNGYHVNASARAIDVASMAYRVSHPQPGDLRYSGRRGGGHVEMVAEIEGGKLTDVNFNKGGNVVGLSHRRIAGGVYFRPYRVASR